MTNLMDSLGDMKTDQVGIPIMDEKDIMELMYRSTSPANVFVDDHSLFENINRSVKNLGFPLTGINLKMYQSRTPDDMTNHWCMPQDYASIDIESWFADRITTEEQALRVAEELSLYRDGGLYPLLRFLIYLVDLMREHRIVWGVGRGSSVSSYCLYLIGIHKIDSMKHKLEIKEFLKWQNT